MPKKVIIEPEFDPALYDLRHVIDTGLRAKRDTLPSYTPKGWRSSSLGYCPRRQFYERAAVPKPDDGFLASRTLWLGDMIHHGVQQMFRNSGLLIVEELALEDPDLHVQGHVDMVWGGVIPPELLPGEEGYSPKWQAFLLKYRADLLNLYGWERGFPITGTELKSAAQYSAEKMYAEGPQFHHVMQTASYKLMADRHREQLPDVLRKSGVDRWEIGVLAKSDLAMPRFDISATHVERVLERIEGLNAAWDAREVPECRCGKDISWEANYCAYKDGGGCCGSGLIEFATSEEFWAGVETNAKSRGIA